MPKYWTKPHLYLFHILLFIVVLAAAQPCNESQWIKTYTGSETQTYAKSLLTASKNLLSIGNIQYQKNNIVHNDGWVSVYSASGLPIFQKI